MNEQTLDSRVKALEGSKVSVQAAREWGERGEPQPLTVLLLTDEEWMEGEIDSKSDRYPPTETLGVYLGNGLILVVPPSQSEVRKWM